MKKIILLASTVLLSIGAWANNDYEQCISENMSELDNVSKSECAEIVKSHEQTNMSNLLKQITTSSQFDSRDKSIMNESQKAFITYKNKQCSLFVNNGASADGLIAKEFCEIGLIEQRNQFLNSIVTP